MDEFTGRLMTGGVERRPAPSRGSQGKALPFRLKPDAGIDHVPELLPALQQACGMTGTADTEAYEFQEIYGLETVVIPPNKPSRRDDQPGSDLQDNPRKYQAAIDDIRECYERGSRCWWVQHPSKTRDHRPVAGSGQTAPSSTERQATCARSGHWLSRLVDRRMITIATNILVVGRTSCWGTLENG